MTNLFYHSLRGGLLLAILCCIHFAAFSQTALKGTVTDPLGNPLEGVTVSNQTQGHVTKTDEQGGFSVQAKVSDVISFSSIGYQSHKLTLENLASVRISLDPSGEDLEEVVVLGYGSIKKSNLTGSVSRLDKRVLDWGSFKPCIRIGWNNSRLEGSTDFRSSGFCSEHCIARWNYLRRRRIAIGDRGWIDPFRILGYQPRRYRVHRCIKGCFCHGNLWC